MAFGMTMGQMQSEARIMIEFFEVLNNIIMKICMIVMWCVQIIFEIIYSVLNTKLNPFSYAPVGLMSLIAAKILSVDDLYSTGSSLGMYMVTVIVGVCFHGFVTLSLIFYVITRRNPFKFLRGMVQACVTAATISSRYATSK